jgi:hypothetical protein
LCLAAHQWIFKSLQSWFYESRWSRSLPQYHLRSHQLLYLVLWPNQQLWNSRNNLDCQIT